MANTLSPWIFDYLIDIAENLGARIYDAKPFAKKKKVQITEFLTYPPDGQEDTVLWARVSDKKHICTVKFMREAVTDFNKIRGKRLTQHKGAIVTISNFRPIHSRFPLEQDRLSDDPFVVLECNQVDLLGSLGEATFGQPKGIETEPDIILWTDGLAQDGGAGNVLKERKAQREGKAMQVGLPPMPTPPTPRQPNVEAPVKLKPPKRIEDTDLASYMARWQPLRELMEPPAEELTANEEAGSPSKLLIDHLRDGNTPDGMPARSRSGTPFTWASSPPKSLSLTAPTPAQRTRPNLPEPSSSYMLGNETQVSATRRASMERKVPLPTSPEPAEVTGPARVLVENSDSSQSQPSALLGGLVQDTSGEMGWMGIGAVASIARRSYELRLHNLC